MAPSGKRMTKSAPARTPCARIMEDGANVGSPLASTGTPANHVSCPSTINGMSLIPNWNIKIVVTKVLCIKILCTDVIVRQLKIMMSE